VLYNDEWLEAVVERETESGIICEFPLDESDLHEGKKRSRALYTSGFSTMVPFSEINERIRVVR